MAAPPAHLDAVIDLDRSASARSRRHLRVVICGNAPSCTGFDGDLIQGLALEDGTPRFMRRRPNHPELMQRGIQLTLEPARPVAYTAQDLGINRGGLRHRVRPARSGAGTTRREMIPCRPGSAGGVAPVAPGER